MAIKSDNLQGNPYHDESNGQFTSKDGFSGGGSASSLNYIPQTTSAGGQRRFFSDYTVSEKEQLFNKYFSNHGREAQIIAQLKDLYDTSRDNSVARQRKREGWIEDEFNQQMLTPKKQERKATLLLGLPGSGKSTIAKNIMDENGAFIIDADNFKERIPEFQRDHMMVSAVHDESVGLSNQFRDRLTDKGYNVVVGKVGGDYESIENTINDLTNKGYQIDVVLNDVPLEVAMDRTIGRYERKESKRLVPLAILIESDKNIFNTFDKVLQNKSVTGGRLYSNDVPRGNKPVLLKQF